MGVLLIILYWGAGEGGDRRWPITTDPQISAGFSLVRGAWGAHFQRGNVQEKL